RAKLFVGIHSVYADAQNHGIFLHVLTLISRKAVSFDGAARRASLRIEVKNDPVSLEIMEADWLALLVNHTAIRCHAASRWHRPVVGALGRWNAGDTHAGHAE